LEIQGLHIPLWDEGVKTRARLNQAGVPVRVRFDPCRISLKMHQKALATVAHDDPYSH